MEYLYFWKQQKTISAYGVSSANKNLLSKDEKLEITTYWKHHDSV